MNGLTRFFVLGQQSLSIVQAEIFKVDESIGEEVGGSSDEAINEVVVLLTSKPGVAPTEVEVRVKQLLVISAYVKADAENFGGVDTGA